MDQVTLGRPTPSATPGAAAKLSNFAISRELCARTIGHGTNRAEGKHKQIGAETDIDAVTAWLSRYLDKPTTFSSYRKEAERLLIWCAIEEGKPLSSLTHEDWLRFKLFLAKPSPPERWVTKSGRKFSRASPDWKPFAGPLSPASVRQAGIILNGMFTWLVSAGYLAGNPLALSRERGRPLAKRVTRYLDEDTWAVVKLSIEALPKETQRQRQHYTRFRWLLSLMYGCGLRISEVVENSMGGFFERRDKNGVSRWWLEVIGKGNKPRTVPATKEIMRELASYRTSLGLSLTPSPGEETPLVVPIGGQSKCLSRGALHVILKQVFSLAAAELRAGGSAYVADADRLLSASAHWLRHTAGSHMANNQVDLRYVRDNLGHESIATTDVYLHSEDELRHDDTAEKHRIAW